MKKSFLFALATLCLSAGAADLVVADGPRSDYQIVIPDALEDKTLDDYVALGGKVIRTAVRKASGAELPLVRESRKLPGKPAIYVGNVKALGGAGLSSKDFAVWEHAVAVRGKDIFCYGKDLGNPFKTSNMFPALRFPKYFVHFAPGSLKAACTFAEQFLNTRFVIPKFNAYGEHDGIRTLPRKRIAVPEKFALRRQGRFRHQGDMGGILYSVANNFYFGHGEGYNVHYHAYSIPQDKYYKDHPEYFALVDGKRLYHKATAIYGARPQYCLSNPEVRELIYKNALERADLGYKVVEFGQSDGFIGCECDKCKKMYGTPDWGEKLWRLHAELAARLEKDRPGVIPAIACYGASHKVPRTLKKFPTKRMIIDVAPATKKLIEEWKKFNVTGMAAWTYYFGSYKASSYAPSADFDFLKKELKWMRSTPVTYFYNCGINVAPALNGPWVYAYGKFCGDPELDTDKLLEEYCLFTYGEKAVPFMVKFFKLLDDRSRLFPPDQNEDYNDFKRRRQNSADLWEKRYTPAVLAELKKLLGQAEKVWLKSEFTERLKREFTYLLLTAEANNAGKALQKNYDKANRLALADAIEKREAFLNSLPIRNGYVVGAFHNPRMVHLRAGGSMSGLFAGPMNSDPKILRQEMKNMDLVKVEGFADPAWEKIPAQGLLPLKKSFPAVSASFKAAFTDKALLLVCEAPLESAPAVAPPRDSTKLWKDAVWEIFISTGRDRRQLVFSAASRSAFDAVIDAVGNSSVRWHGNWSHKDTVKEGVWRSEVTIPFAGTIGSTPAPGEIWWLQAAFSAPGALRLYAWNPPLSGSFSDISSFGKIRFGARPAEREIYINGDFKEQKLWRSANGKGQDPTEFTVLDGKNVVKFGYKNLAWGGLSSSVLTALADDEEAVFTVTIRGRGRGALGAGWRNIAGRFAVNSNEGTSFTLSDQPQVVSYTIRLTPRIRQKGGALFYPNIFLRKPGGEAFLEKAELKIRKIR